MLYAAREPEKKVVHSKIVGENLVTVIACCNGWDRKKIARGRIENEIVRKNDAIIMNG